MPTHQCLYPPLHKRGTIKYKQKCSHLALGSTTGLINPQGRPLQPGTIIFCDDLLFIVSANGRIYNYTGGNTKQLYVADPRQHKFLVNEANRPGTITVILGSV